MDPVLLLIPPPPRRPVLCPQAPAGHLGGLFGGGGQRGVNRVPPPPRPPRRAQAPRTPPPEVSLGKTLTRYFQHFLNQVPLNRAAQINWRQKAQILSRPSPIPIFQPCLLCNYGLARCGRATTGANVQPPGFSLPGAPRGGRRPAARGAPCRGTGWPRGRRARGGAGGRASSTPACKGRSGRRQRHRSLQVPGAAEVSAPTIP